MADAGAGPSMTWDEWVEQGRKAADAEACLLRFLESETDTFTRSDIVMALGYVGSSRSWARLIDLLNDNAPTVAMEAAAGLGRLGNHDAVPDLVAALKSRDPNVRANACQALGALGGSQGADALTDARRDNDPFVRSAAEEALARVAAREHTS